MPVAPRPLFGVTLLPSEPRPLPDTPCEGSREPVPQLPCHHDQLSPMMSLVRGKEPMLLIQVHRLLCMWAAIIPTVSREMPGTCLDQTAGGSCSTRYVVARLLVRHAAMMA